MSKEVTLTLDAWLRRVRNNLDQLDAMDCRDERRQSLMRETTALFEAADRSGLRERYERIGRADVVTAIDRFKTILDQLKSRNSEGK